MSERTEQASQTPTAATTTPHPWLRSRQTLILLVGLGGFLGVAGHETLRRALPGIFAPGSEPWQAINALPATITRPGKYRLARDLEYDHPEGPAIFIAADGVTLDLQGKTLRYVGDRKRDLTIAIEAAKRKDITVRNGTIVGFHYGVWLSDFRRKDMTYAPKGGWHRVEDMVIRECSFRGIRTEGIQNIVRGNRVFSTGGTTAYPGAFAFGIEVIGSDALIERNSVVDTYGVGPKSEGVGIGLAASSLGSIIRFNSVRNGKRGDGRTIGIWGGGDGLAWVRDNVVINMTWGIAGSSDSRGILESNRTADCDEAVYDAGRWLLLDRSPDLQPSHIRGARVAPNKATAPAVPPANE